VFGGGVVSVSCVVEATVGAESAVVEELASSLPHAETTKVAPASRTSQEHQGERDMLFLLDRTSLP
jgi:hypothetical protein